MNLRMQLVRLALSGLACLSVSARVEGTRGLRAAEAPPPRLRNPDTWRFLEPHGVIIFTSDEQLRAVARDPEAPVKGLDLGAPDRAMSLREWIDRAAEAGQTRVTISFDFFFGGNARTLHPTHPDFIEAVVAIARVAATRGLGIGASVLNPLDFGRDFRAIHGVGGEQHGFHEGALEADGRFALEVPIEKVWANNKGPIALELARVRAFAFREDPLPSLPYLFVPPESIEEIPSPALKPLPDPSPARPGAYHRGLLRVEGRIERPEGRNRVLVVVIHRTPEADYFHPEAGNYIRGIVDLYDRLGVRFQEFYSDEMHIQFDWDLGAHGGLKEIRTRYLTPNFERALADLLPETLRDSDKMLVYHGFHEEGGVWGEAQHVLGPRPEEVERTFLLRKLYFERLQGRVTSLCLDALKYAETLYGFAPSTQAHATWQESPTCDRFAPGGIFQGALAAGVSPYEFSPAYESSSAIREATSACYDYFAWNDFFTAGGNDFLECGLLDRDYHGGAMAASFAALNRYSTSYWGAWGFPGALGAHVGAVLEAYGSSTGPHALVQGLEFRTSPIAIVSPLDLLYRNERFGSWTVQYGYANYLSEEKLLERGRVEAGILVAGRGAYRTIYVPFLAFPREETLALLERFAEGGGTVIWGSIPPLLSREGKPVRERWSKLFGAIPTANLDGLPAGVLGPERRLRFVGPLERLAPMLVPTDLLVDRLHPVTAATDATAVASGGGLTLGCVRPLGKGKLVTLGFRLRDDQSRSTGEDVSTLTDVLEALGAFGSADSSELASRRGPLLVTRFRNGAVSLAPHFREIREGWDGGFFRDAKRDAESLASRTLPSLALELKDTAIAGQKVSYSGTRLVSWRAGEEGLLAFAGEGTTGIEIAGKRYTFTTRSARVSFAPVAPERLPEGVIRGFHVQSDAEELTLPISFSSVERVRAYRDVLGDGRRLEPVETKVEPRPEGGIRIRPAGGNLVLLEEAGA